MTSAAVLQSVLGKMGSEFCRNWTEISNRSGTNLGHFSAIKLTPQTSFCLFQFFFNIWCNFFMKLRCRNSASLLPEVTVGMNDPHAKALDPGLFSSNTFMTAKHAQGELVDPRLQHGSKLPLKVGGLVLWHAIITPFILWGGVQQAIRIGCVVVIVSLHQGEERPGHIGLLVCLRGWGCRGGSPLGATSPSWETEAAPAAVPGCLWFVSRALIDAPVLAYAPGGASHFYTLHFKLVQEKGVLLSL